MSIMPSVEEMHKMFKYLDVTYKAEMVLVSNSLLIFLVVPTAFNYVLDKLS